MFQSARQNSQVYLLHKGDNPYVETGTITSAPQLKPKYSIPQSFGQQEMVVNLTINVNGVNHNFKELPSNLDIADVYMGSDCVSISDSRDAINNEVLSLKKKSMDIIDGYEKHKALIVVYDNILKDINPEFAERQSQREEIESLKIRLASMESSTNQLLDANKLLLERLSKLSKED